MNLVAGAAPCLFSAPEFTRCWALHNIKSFGDKGRSERREKFCCSLENPPPSDAEISLRFSLPSSVFLRRMFPTLTPGEGDAGSEKIQFHVRHGNIW